MCTDTIDMAGWVSAVEGLGPGVRTVVWVRGCSRACPGCIAPDLQRAGPSRLDVASVAGELTQPLARTRRLTISGGEPFDQPEALASLVGQLEDAVGDFEVLIYTGYRIEELDSDECRALLEHVDILIDGPYDEREDDSLIWRGSDNQRLLLLSGRARADYASYDRLTWEGGRQLSIVAPDPATILLIGIPSRNDLTGISAHLAVDGYRTNEGD